MHLTIFLNNPKTSRIPMKKLLLALSLMCALPLSAMQEPMKDHLKKQAGPCLLLAGTFMTTAAITGGGCTAFPPLTLLVGGAYAMKKGYDWYYKQELLNQAKGK